MNTLIYGQAVLDLLLGISTPNFDIPGQGEISLRRYFAVGDGSASSIADIRNRIQEFVTGDLSGTVASGGEPLADASVSVFQTLDATTTPPSLFMVGNSRTDSDGQYAMTLPPGEYAYQINADSRCEGSTTWCKSDDDCPGTACVVLDPDYTIHFTVESCPTEACCVGDTCLETNALDCAAQFGTFLAGTHRDHPLMGCQGDVCSLGTCCLPGQCRDDAAADTLAECETLGGVYLGGVTCDVGPCPACPFDVPASCQQVQTIFGPCRSWTEIR